MNNLKKKLFAATAMLVVSAVMLGSSTFAWYTLSTAPEITAVQFNMAANENLEIALDNGYDGGENSDGVTKSVDAASTNASVQGGVQGSTKEDYYTWGNVIDLTKAIENVTTPANAVAGTSAVNKIALKPVKYLTAPSTVPAAAAGDLLYPKYGDDGRIDEMAKLKAFFKNANISTGTVPAVDGGFAVYGQSQPSDNTDNNSTYDAFSVTYWLRTNMATEAGGNTTKVSLSADGKERAKSSEDGTADNDPNDIKGLGSYILAPGATSGTYRTGELVTLINSGKLVIQFDVYDGTSGALHTKLFAKAGNAGADGKATLSLVTTKPTGATGESLSDGFITLTKNTGLKVKTYVYLDGEKITNADALLADLNNIELNLQFFNSAIDDAIDVA